MNKDDKKFDDFVDKYIDYDLNEIETTQTDWEGKASAHSVSPLATKKYLRFLRVLKYILMSIFALIIIGIVGLSFKFLLFTKFEMFVFDDGTDVMCIYDPSTGEIKQNDN